MTQLAEVVEVLDGVGLRYWVDAGSLLGLVRDGQLLPWDKDIDLGCWDGEIPRAIAAATEFRRRGYHLAARRYRGNLYQLRLRPPLRALLDGSRFIDLAIFRRRASSAWSPINCVQPPPARRLSVAWLVQRPLREAVIQRWVRDQDRGPRLTKIPRLELQVRTWVVPAYHFLASQEFQGQDATVPLPDDAEGYLTLRYGDWRQPRSAWNYCEDDGAMDPRPPEQVLPTL